MCFRCFPKLLHNNRSTGNNNNVNKMDEEEATRRGIGVRLGFAPLQMPFGGLVLPEYTRYDETSSNVQGSLCNGEPPPPYSEKRKALSELPLNQPPKYSQSIRRGQSTSEAAVVDAPFIFNKKFLTSKLAAFKVAECIICLIGIASMAVFRKTEAGQLHKDLNGFFLFLMIACMMFSFIVSWLYLISIFDISGYDTKSRMLATLHIGIGVSLLITSSFIAEADVKNICNSKDFDANQCVLHRISLATGFIAMAIFWLDSVVQMHGRKAS